MPECPFCAAEVPPGAERCASCDGETPGDSVYELPDVEIDLPGLEAKLPGGWQNVASYSLEAAARCPHCREPIRSVRVLRMTRTQVTFTSTLPRGGRAIVCVECERIISIELSTFV